jgi:Fic family protein
MPTSIEMPYRIEPCLLENIPIGMTDLIASLTTSSERLANRLHPRTVASLAELVRIMNCYYSNLIEGHHTKPRDIERALADDLEKDELQRNFQIEALGCQVAALDLPAICGRAFAGAGVDRVLALAAQ